MRGFGRILWIALAVSILVQPALAQDRRFAVRLGGVGMSPTGESVVGGESNRLDSSFGVEGNFEWYINKHLGLEASVAFATDSDVDSNDDMTSVTGITTMPATLGINAHVLRTEAVDWSFGILGGVIRYGDFDFQTGGGSGSSGSSEKLDTAGAFGVQTSADIAIGTNDRWGVNLGIKFLESDLDPENSALPSIDVNPLHLRVMAVFRWGNTDK